MKDNKNEPNEKPNFIELKDKITIKVIETNPESETISLNKLIKELEENNKEINTSVIIINDDTEK